MRTLTLCTLLIAIAGCSGSREELESQRTTIEALNEKLANEQRASAEAKASVKQLESQLAETRQKLQSMTEAHDLIRQAFDRLSAQSAEDEAALKARDDARLSQEQADAESMEREFALLTEQEQQRVKRIRAKLEKGEIPTAADYHFATQEAGQPFLLRSAITVYRKLLAQSSPDIEKALDFLKLSESLRASFYAEGGMSGDKPALNTNQRRVTMIVDDMMAGKPLSDAQIRFSRESIYLRDRVAEYQKAKQ